MENGVWDFGDMRCEGPVCDDPGRPSDGIQISTSYAQGSEISLPVHPARIHPQHFGADPVRPRPGVPRRPAHRHRCSTLLPSGAITKRGRIFRLRFRRLRRNLPIQHHLGGLGASGAPVPA